MWKKYYVLDGLNGIAKHFLVDSEDEGIEKIYRIYEKAFLLRIKEASVLQRIEDVLYELEAKLESDDPIDDFYVHVNDWFVDDLQRFFKENEIDVYVEYVDDYIYQSDLENKEEWYILRLTFGCVEPFELNPIHTFDEGFVFRYRSGGSFRYEQIEDISFAYLSEDFISLDEWDGQGFSTGEPGNHVRIHRIWTQKDGFYELYKAKYVAVQTSDSSHLPPVISDVICDDDDLQYVLRCYNRVGRGYEELVRNIGILDMRSADMRSAKEVFVLKNKPNRGEHICLFETESGEYMLILGKFDYESGIIDFREEGFPPDIAVFKEKRNSNRKIRRSD